MKKENNDMSYQNQANQILNDLDFFSEYSYTMKDFELNDIDPEYRNKVKPSEIGLGDLRY